MLIRYIALVLLACSLLCCSPSRESADVPSSEDADVSLPGDSLNMERLINDSAKAYGLGSNLAGFPLGDNVFFYLFEGPEYSYCSGCQSEVTAIKFVYENNQVELLEVLIDFPIGVALRGFFNEDIRIHPLDDSLALLYDVEQWDMKGTQGELHTFKVISTSRNTATNTPNHADLMLDVYHSDLDYGWCYNTVQVEDALVSSESCSMDYTINADGSMNIMEYGARTVDVLSLSNPDPRERYFREVDSLCAIYSVSDTGCRGCCSCDYYWEFDNDAFRRLEPYSKSHHITFDGQSFNVDQIDSEYVRCYYFF